MTFTCEEDLRQSFLRQADSALWCPSPKPGPVRSAIESTCSDGRADWVWATLHCALSRCLGQVTFDLMQQPTCSRILAALKVKRRQPEDVLYSAAGVSRRTYRKLLADLLNSKLVTMDKTGLLGLGPTFRMPDIEICSFEFKLENWRRAFQQARRYRSFSHRVYVVMPRRGVTRALRHADSFRRFNIGLIQHESDGTSARRIASRKRTPSSPAHHIQAIGLLGSQRTSIPARRAKSDKARLQLAK